MKKYFAILASAVFAAFAFAAKDSSPAAFKAGSNVCFLGDSITQGGKYVKNIALFYATRYPLDRVNFYDKGIGGDTIQHLCMRLDEDVLSVKPNFATLMIGMNNIQYYHRKDMNDGFRAKIPENRKMYSEKLAELMDRLAAANCSLILFTPSPYDETAKISKPANVGKNSELSYFSRVCKRMAHQRGLALVDMWSNMMRFKVLLQKDRPKLSVGGVDRIHPDAMGGFMMMSIFVDAMGEEKIVSAVDIDAGRGALMECFNCDVSNLKASADGASFDLFEYSLPFPLDESAKLGDKYAGFAEEFNRQILKIGGLKEGKYALKIGGAKVGEYTSEELAEGVNLGLNEATPQCAQAFEAAKAAQKYIAFCYKLREINISEMIHKLDEIDTAEKRIERMEKILKTTKITHAHIRKCAMAYKDTKPKQAEMLAHSLELLSRVYDAAAPKKRRYIIEKID